MSDLTKNHSSEAILNNNPMFYLIVGMVFLLSYFLIAQAVGFFIDNDFTYVSRSRVPFGSLHQSYMKYFTKMQLSAIVWKILTLFPGALFLSIFLAMKVDHPRTEKMLRTLGSTASSAHLSILFVIALIVISFFSFIVLNQTKITDDEEAYRFQARVLNAGMLYAPAPPVEGNFVNEFMIIGDKYTGKYTLGLPAIIALGMALGSEYIFTILFAALSLFTIYAIAMQQYNNKPTALLASTLLVLSPFYLITSATLLTHSSMLFLLSLFMLSFLKTIKTGNFLYAALCGITLGIAINVRPNTAVFFSIPLVCFGVYHMIKNKGERFFQFFVSLLLFFLFFGVLAWYNKEITGSHWVFPFHEYDPTEKFGFGKMLNDNAYLHTPMKGILNLLVSVVKLNSWVFGIPVSLIFIMFLLISGKFENQDALNGSIILSICLFQIMYYSPGVSDTGPLYYFELLIPIVLLSARGLVEGHKMCIRLKERGFSLGSTIVPAFTVVSFGLALITFVPENTIRLMNLADKIDEPYREVKSLNLHNAVVFVRSLPLAGWVFGIKTNSPQLDDDVIFVRESTIDNNLKLMDHFGQRSYYLLEYKAREGRTQITPYLN